MSTATFVCGEKTGHEHVWDGPEIYFLSDGSTTFDKSKRGKGCVGGAITCSICGVDSMSNSLWRGE